MAMKHIQNHSISGITKQSNGVSIPANIIAYRDGYFYFYHGTKLAKIHQSEIV